MTARIVSEAVAVARAALNILTVARETRGGDLDAALVGLAVELGHLEKRPMDISAIAAVTGIARTTVHRKLRDMEASGELTRKRVGPRAIMQRVDEGPHGTGRLLTAVRAVRGPA